MAHEYKDLGQIGLENKHVWVVLVDGELGAALHLGKVCVLRFIAAKHVPGQQAPSSADILLSHVKENLAREHNLALCHDNCLSRRGEVLMARHGIRACARYEGEMKVLSDDNATKMRDDFFVEVVAALERLG